MSKAPRVNGIDVVRPLTRRQAVILLGGVALSSCRGPMGPTTPPDPSFQWSIYEHWPDQPRDALKSFISGMASGVFGPVEVEAAWPTLSVWFYHLRPPWVARTRVRFGPCDINVVPETPLEREHRSSDAVKWSFGPPFGAKSPYEARVRFESELSGGAEAETFTVDVTLRFVWFS